MSALTLAALASDSSFPTAICSANSLKPGAELGGRASSAAGCSSRNILNPGSVKMFVIARQNEMESVAALEVFDSWRRSQLVITGVGIAQGREQPPAVLVRRIDPEIDVFGEGRGP